MLHRLHQFPRIKEPTKNVVVALLLVGMASGAAEVASACPFCTVRPDNGGGPVIMINGKPHSPIMIFLNNQFGRDGVLLREIRQAGNAGVNFISFNLPLGWYTTDNKAAGVLAKFCNANPHAYFYPRIWLGANTDWLKTHPQDCITKADGTRLNLASPSSPDWRKSTADLLRARIKQILASNYANRFIGVDLTYLQTGEWFYPDTNDFMDYSPVNVVAFRSWLKKKYRKDRALREAWNNAHVTLANADLPKPAEWDRGDWGVFRNPNWSRRAMDATQFQSDLIANTIGYFAAVVKSVTRRHSLVGAFYGYTMELSGNGPRALSQSGHLSMAKLLANKNIDLIHAPYSYFERKIGEPSHLHLLADSVPLHQKLVVIEDDTYTHLARQPDPKLIAPGWAARTRNIEETLAVTRRNYASFLTHRCGLWYCDLLSDGRWSDPKFWQSVPLLLRMAAQVRGDGPFRPQVAFAVSERSVCLLRATTAPLLKETLYLWRSELDRIGAPIGYYLQSDLPRLPNSVKLLILPDAYELRNGERKAIKNLLRRGATVLWTYAPNLAGPAGLDPTRIGATTGINVQATFDNVSPSFTSEVTPEEHLFGNEKWQPRFHVTSTDVQVLARYKANHEVCAAARPMDGGVCVYTAVPRLPVGLLRWICTRSRVHLYRDTPGMTGVIGNYLVVHTQAGGPQRFHWPVKCKTVERLVPFIEAPIARLTNTWADDLPPKTTAIYLCSPM